MKTSPRPKARPMTKAKSKSAAGTGDKKITQRRLDQYTTGITGMAMGGMASSKANAAAAGGMTAAAAGMARKPVGMAVGGMATAKPVKPEAPVKGTATTAPKAPKAAAPTAPARSNAGGALRGQDRAAAVKAMNATKKASAPAKAPAKPAKPSFASGMMTTAMNMMKGGKK